MLRRCCRNDEMRVVILQVMQETRDLNRVGSDAIVDVASVVRRHDNRPSRDSDRGVFARTQDRAT